MTTYFKRRDRPGSDRWTDMRKFRAGEDPEQLKCVLRLGISTSILATIVWQNTSQPTKALGSEGLSEMI